MFLIVVSFLFIIIYCIFSNDNTLILKFANSSFILAFTYLTIGLLIYVRNIGFFKILSYHQYKRRFLKAKEAMEKGTQIEKDLTNALDLEETPLEFHEFVAKKYSKKWNNKIFFLTSLIFLIISIITSYLFLK